MTRNFSLAVAHTADRFRWWAAWQGPAPAPGVKATVAKSPAAAGWTMEEWCARSGIGRAALPDDRFAQQYPSPLDVSAFGSDSVVRAALRKLVSEDIVEPVPGRDQVWRAREKPTRRA